MLCENVRTVPSTELIWVYQWHRQDLDLEQGHSTGGV